MVHKEACLHLLPPGTTPATSLSSHGLRPLPHPPLLGGTAQGMGTVTDRRHTNWVPGMEGRTGQVSSRPLTTPCPGEAAERNTYDMQIH